MQFQFVVLHGFNGDWKNINTPVDVRVLHDLLEQTRYSKSEAGFLIDGFTNGFSLGHQSPTDRQDSSSNIPFTVGNKLDMWNKLIKEVNAERVAGPLEFIPFKNFVQSPIGLVPKAGNQTRLIFHLSYKFKNGNESINFWTPDELCTVHYNDIDHAVNNCLYLLEEFNTQVERLYFGKTDLKSAFRILPG